MTTLRASFISFMLVNLTKGKILHSISYCYTGLGGHCSTKDAIGSFFHRAL